MSKYPWVGFLIGVIALLFLDLKVFHSRFREIKTKQKVLETFFWIATALLFNAGFASYYGSAEGIEFLTSYLVEKSLSIDNLFIILLIFDSMHIPQKFRHDILFYGILGVILMRGGLIFLGIALLQHFQWVFYIFGIILIVTAIKFLFKGDQDNKINENALFKFLNRIFSVSDKIEGNRFFIKKSGKIYVTRLFISLILIEMSDLIFALDSIPAVLSITQNKFIAFASNILAVLGLRALYFLIADWISHVRYLKPGLATLLGFIGVKMILAEVYPIPSWVSLLVISMVLLTAGLTSWYSTRMND